MERSILLGGFGGQGVQTIGKLLTYAANDADCFVTFFPAYGGQMRGGTSNCTVVVSNDKPIASPSRKSYDYFIALNEPSYVRFRDQVKKGGTIIVNSDLVTDVPESGDITYVKIPLNTLADQVGSQKVMNVIMLAFISKYFSLIPAEVIHETVRKKLGKKAEFIELNDKAFALGLAYENK
jgi:2-oxoglutarate ferredoxin oxidoreductase subunit gamma